MRHSLCFWIIFYDIEHFQYLLVNMLVKPIRHLIMFLRDAYHCPHLFVLHVGEGVYIILHSVKQNNLLFVDDTTKHITLDKLNYNNVRMNRILSLLVQCRKKKLSLAACVKDEGRLMFQVQCYV